MQETATAKAQVDAVSKGRSAEVYDRILDETNHRRKEIQARLATMEAPVARPVLDARNEGEQIAEVRRRVEAVLSAEELTPAEKYLILAKVI